MASQPWYTIQNIEELDTPALVVYPDRVKENINVLINSIQEVDRLRPHIKTHKSAEVTQMMLQAGITKFKCATIAEAEMLGEAGAPDVLLAYQPVGPKAKRFSELVKSFPGTIWSCLIDNIDSAKHISSVSEKSNQTISAYIDLNVGMNRTGIPVNEALKLFNECASLKGLHIIGLHVYDGHIRDIDFTLRTKRCDEVFGMVKDLQENIFKKSGKRLTIVAGGTPTYSIHSKRKEIECSPGTYVYWDIGYEKLLQEQHYQHAALVVTRVVSKPADDIICVDLGHKAIAAENPLSERVLFLNAPELQPLGHSEEHMVFKTQPGEKYNVGDVLYGVPFHICPTVALHDIAYAVVGHEIKETWHTEARKRKITI